MSAILAQYDFLICRVEERGVAVAAVIDDNTAYEKSDKSIWRLFNFRCTSTSFTK